MLVNVLGNPVEVFLDTNGQPLNGGSIYIAQPNTDPTNPANWITVYQDAGLSIPLQQPIKTSNGQPVLNGSQIPVYLGLGVTAYSLAVVNAGGVIVMSLPSVAPFSLGGSAAGSMVYKEFVAGVDFPAGTAPTLTLPANFGSASNVFIDFDGILQKPGVDYTLNGTQLVITAIVPAGTQTINARGGVTASVGTPGAGTVTDASVAAGSKLYDRVYDMLSVTDFGAKGDGVTNDLPSFTAGAAAVKGPLFVPPNRSYNLGGSVSFLNGLGYYDTQASSAPPSTTIQISRDISSVGTTGSQTGGLIVYNTVEAGVQHHEFGLFSVLTNKATSNLNQPVGFYSQANSEGAGASPLWAGVFEVTNIRPDGVTMSTASSTLAGLEVDVANHFAFDSTLKKLGITCIAYGGGECNEAFTARSQQAGAPGNGFESGYWRVGFWIQAQGLNPTLGTGLLIDSNHNNGITIDGVSASYGINLAGAAGSATGLRISNQYATPIVIPPNAQIQMNDVGGGAIGIEYNNALGSGAVILASAGIGVSGHTTQASAAAGSASALPATPAGYLSFWVNGTLQKVPFYN